MAAGNWIKFPYAHLKCLDGTIDLLNDSFRVVLVTASYSPNTDAHTAWSDISTHEVTAGGGYSIHGIAVAGITLTRPGNTNIIQWDANNFQWLSSTITAKYAVIVRDADANGSLAAGDIPVFLCDLNSGGGSVSSSSTDFDILNHADGIYRETVAAS